MSMQHAYKFKILWSYVLLLQLPVLVQSCPSVTPIIKHTHTHTHTASLHGYHQDSDIPETITRYDGTTIHGRTLPEKYEPPTCILRQEEEGQGEGEVMQCG